MTDVRKTIALANTKNPSAINNRKYFYILEFIRTHENKSYGINDIVQYLTIKIKDYAKLFLSDKKRIKDVKLSLEKLSKLNYLKNKSDLLIKQMKKTPKIANNVALCGDNFISLEISLSDLEVLLKRANEILNLFPINIETDQIKFYQDKLILKGVPIKYQPVDKTDQKTLACINKLAALGNLIKLNIYQNKEKKAFVDIFIPSFYYQPQFSHNLGLTESKNTLLAELKQSQVLNAERSDRLTYYYILKHLSLYAFNMNDLLKFVNYRRNQRALTLYEMTNLLTKMQTEKLLDQNYRVNKHIVLVPEHFYELEFDVSKRQANKLSKMINNFRFLHNYLLAQRLNLPIDENKQKYFNQAKFTKLERKSALYSIRIDPRFMRKKDDNDYYHGMLTRLSLTKDNELHLPNFKNKIKLEDENLVNDLKLYFADNNKQLHYSIHLYFDTVVLYLEFPKTFVFKN